MKTRLLLLGLTTSLILSSCSANPNVRKGQIGGAAVGGIAGGGKGAAIGAGAGAGAGVIVMLATQGDELVLEAGQQMYVNMTSPTSVQIAAQN